ncbi:MAG: hypothetical protein M3Z46_09635, partial [Actinomycetota bacterium]|nr:hypothetical protein [Actinomycetota bacterium]
VEVVEVVVVLAVVAVFAGFVVVVFPLVPQALATIATMAIHARIHLLLRRTAHTLPFSVLHCCTRRGRLGTVRAGGCTHFPERTPAGAQDSLD